MKCPICKFQAKQCNYYRNIDKRFLCRYCDINFNYSLIARKILEFTKFIDLNETTYIVHWAQNNKTEIWKGAAATKDDLVVTFNFWIPILKDQNSMVNKLKTVLLFL